jgi:hypothetical protein
VQDLRIREPHVRATVVREAAVLLARQKTQPDMCMVASSGGGRKSMAGSLSMAGCMSASGSAFTDRKSAAYSQRGQSIKGTAAGCDDEPRDPFEVIQSAVASRAAAIVGAEPALSTTLGPSDVCCYLLRDFRSFLCSL